MIESYSVINMLESSLFLKLCFFPELANYSEHEGNHGHVQHLLFIILMGTVEQLIWAINKKYFVKYWI